MSTRLSRKQSQARTRRLLIDAGAKAFRRHGFYRASAEAIAADAGFTRGALYANFDGKEGLFLAVLDEEIVRRRDMLNSPLDPAALAERYEQLLDGDPDWTLALLEFTIHAAREPQLKHALVQRNRELRAAIVSLLDPRAAGAGSARGRGRRQARPRHQHRGIPGTRARPGRRRTSPAGASLRRCTRLTGSGNLKHLDIAPLG